MTERPIWFQCKYCVFFQERSRDCYFNPENFGTGDGSWCSNWTCATCWQKWDDYFFPAVENDRCGPSGYPLVNGNTQAYVNHLKCKPRRFGNREEIGYQNDQ